MAVALFIGHFHWRLLRDSKTGSVSWKERSKRSVLVLLDAKSEEITEIREVVKALRNVLHPEHLEVMMANAHQILDIEIRPNEEVAVGSGVLETHHCFLLHKLQVVVLLAHYLALGLERGILEGEDDSVELLQVLVFRELVGFPFGLEETWLVGGGVDIRQVALSVIILKGHLTLLGRIVHWEGR